MCNNQMSPDLRNFVGKSRLITLVCQAIISITVCSLISNHLIGRCQLFIYALNVYISILSVACLFLRLNLFVFDQEPVTMNFHVTCVYVTNILLFMSFVCAAGNTEDGKGFSKLEAITVLSAISWGVHLCHVTSVTLLYFFHPDTNVLAQGTYETLLSQEEFEDEEIAFHTPIDLRSIPEN